MYNYLEAMKQDIINYIRDEVTTTDFTDIDELKETLEDDLWIDSTITGNGGDDYTDKETSREYLNGNENLLKEALIEFCVDKEKIVDKFFAGDYSYFDSTIRCYMLSQAISAALEEIESELIFAEN
ncbi:MAG: hypothetical protein ACI4YB_03205 [Oscillospiraceae bacterium]